jgi:adenylosuccinate lyase
LALVILRNLTRYIITNTRFRLAEAEQELGLEEITDEALAQIRTALTIEDEEFAIAADHERRVRHDVMVNFKHNSLSGFS